MALDATAREANLRDSIRVFFRGSLPSTVPVAFDRTLNYPDLQQKGILKKTDRWVSITFGNHNPGSISVAFLLLYICTREDNSGYKLAQLRDQVVTVLSDTTTSDGMKRIPLYVSTTEHYSTWSQVGTILVTDFYIGNEMQMEDETKYRLITVRLAWAAKV